MGGRKFSCVDAGNGGVEEATTTSLFCCCTWKLVVVDGLNFCCWICARKKRKIRRRRTKFLPSLFFIILVSSVPFLLRPFELRTNFQTRPTTRLSYSCKMCLAEEVQEKNRRNSMGQREKKTSSLTCYS